MQRTGFVIAALAVFVIGWPALGQQRATLNLVTAGDQNMVDYVKDISVRCSRRGIPAPP